MRSQFINKILLNVTVAIRWVNAKLHYPTICYPPEEGEAIEFTPLPRVLSYLAWHCITATTNVKNWIMSTVDSVQFNKHKSIFFFFFINTPYRLGRSRIQKVYDSVIVASVNRLTFCATIQKCHGSFVKIKFGHLYIKFIYIYS